MRKNRGQLPPVASQCECLGVCRSVGFGSPRSGGAGDLMLIIVHVRARLTKSRAGGWGHYAAETCGVVRLGRETWTRVCGTL